MTNTFFIFSDNFFAEVIIIFMFTFKVNNFNVIIGFRIQDLFNNRRRRFLGLLSYEFSCRWIF